MGNHQHQIRLGACLAAALALGAGLGCSKTKKPTSNPNQDAFRTLKLDVSEVTLPGMSVSPDGQTAVFTLLGHVFQVPAKGGTASQLTAGFAYDSDPAVSPDGARIAFISDRDGSSGNVFVLDLASRKLTQVTRELQASRPVWSPDGKTLAYLRHLSADELPQGTTGLELRTVASTGGNPVVVGLRPYGTHFYLPDGRLSWSVAEPQAGDGKKPAPPRILVEALGADGKPTLLAAGKEPLKHAVASPSGDGVYYATKKGIRFLGFAGGDVRDVAPLKDGVAHLAIAKQGGQLLFGDGGKLWRMDPRGQAPEAIPFTASASVEVRKQVEPKWTPPTQASFTPRAVVSPVLSPDQKRLVFSAAGFLYEQTLDGKPAKRLLDGGDYECDPAFSPDGKRLAYAVSHHGQRHLRVFDFETRQSKTLYSVGGASWAAFPSWSPDGSRIAFQRSDDVWDPFKLFVVSVGSGKVEDLGTVPGSWTTRPHFSPDGRTLYYTARQGAISAVYRRALQPKAPSEAVTTLKRHVNDSLVSPDGKWLAFRRNTEIWIAPLSNQPVQDGDVKRLTDECSRSFSFTPDASAIVYASGNRVWRQPVAGGARVEILINLTFQRAEAKPLLVRRARLLDFQGGKFTEETSMLIQGGKIQWIGSEQGKTLPTNVEILDAAGRYAIPGLNDVHVHSAWANQLTDVDAFIAFGNTSVRDVGASLDTLNALRDRGESTNLPVPRYWFSGEILEGNQPIWGDAFMQIATEQDARTTVQKFKAWGADFIKVYDSMPWHLQNIVAEESQRQGLPLVGHAMPMEVLVRHARQGYASIEHTMNALYSDGAKLLAATGTRWTGTLTCEGGSQIFIHKEHDRLQTDLARRFIAPDKLKASMKGGLLFGAPEAVQRASMETSFALNMMGRRHGVKLRAGTDTTMTEVYFGLSQHWELEFFHMAGYSPLEALKLGTIESAETVGAADVLGALTPGQLGDVVLLDANPLEKLQNTTRIWQVIKGGHVFDPKRMRQEP